MKPILFLVLAFTCNGCLTISGNLSYTDPTTGATAGLVIGNATKKLGEGVSGKNPNK